MRKVLLGYYWGFDRHWGTMSATPQSKDLLLLTIGTFYLQDSVLYNNA